MFTFNEHDFSNDLKGIDIKRQVLPPVSVTSNSIVGKTGSKFIKNNLESSSIEIETMLIEKDKVVYKKNIRKIASKLFTKEPKKLILHDEPNKYYYAILSDDTSLDENAYTGKVTLNFLLLDPISYGEEIIEQLENTTTFNNKGTYESFGFIEIITDAVSSLTINNETTNEILYIEDTFSLNDVIKIDLEKMYITKNGLSIMDKLFLTSDFFVIPTGDFKILITGGIAELKYIERWL